MVVCPACWRLLLPASCPCSLPPVTVTPTISIFPFHPPFRQQPMAPRSTLPSFPQPHPALVFLPHPALFPAGKYLGGPLYRHGPVRIHMHCLGFDQDPAKPTDPGPAFRTAGMDPELARAYERMCHAEWVEQRCPGGGGGDVCVLGGL
jgi:hypothetical protein